MRLKLLILMGCLIVPMVVRAAEEPTLPPAEQRKQDYANLKWQETVHKAEYQQAKRDLDLAGIRIALERQQAEAKVTGVHGASRECHGKKGGCVLFMVVCVVIHLLLTIWVFQDVRKRTTSSGLWVLIVLVSGLLGALVYAIVRLGDIRQSQGA